MALTKNELKLIKNLARKWERDESGLFTAEGVKVVEDLIRAGYEPEYLITTPYWSPDPSLYAGPVEILDQEQVERISALESPTPVIAVFKKPELPSEAVPPQGLCLLLDEIQNPGNLGTILRTADWFGIRKVYCSPGCADPFGPKTVQAAMGALGRVSTPTADGVVIAQGAKDAGLPVYGAFLDGDSVYKAPLEDRGLLILGNEGRGISPALSALVTQKVHIPSFGSGGMESLNVAQAAAVLLSEFRRRG